MPARRIIPRPLYGVLTAGAITVAVSAPATSFGATAPPNDTAAATTQPTRAAAGKPYFDSRRRATASLDASARVQAGAARLKREVGGNVILEVDPLTATPRNIAVLDGFLTKPASDGATAIAGTWIHDHAALLGLDRDDVARLELVKRTGSPAGITHLTYAQTDAGLRAFDSFVRVNVAADGRIVNVVGAPRSDLEADDSRPRLSASEARGAAMRDAGARGAVPDVIGRSSAAARYTRFEDDSRARLVLFGTARGTRLAWYVSTVRAAADQEYIYLVDAEDGAILWRQNVVAHANATAFDYYPVDIGAPNPGHVNEMKNITNWLAPAATTLNGPNAHAYSDVDDDDRADASEEVGPSGGGDWLYPVKLDTTSCAAFAPCTWDSDTPFSWRDTTGPGTGNRAQNAVQAFTFVNTFHDWLGAAPFGFTRADGNFEGDDPVDTQTLDGAATAGGFPDDDHLDNANMSTPPDGQSPRMQMYLFADRGGFVDLNGGDDASIVYHEYTHGLSNRLVTYPDGAGALGAQQSRAMGEAWSDWYAMDYLFGEGYDRDAVNVGFFANGSESSEPGAGTIRTQPLNCEPAQPQTTDGTDDCNGAPEAGNGGYTYGDYGRIIGRPEVHADGEIWAQTLWQLRDRLIAKHGQAEGLRRARLIVTEAMRLSPPQPSFLDQRNAIMAASAAAGHDDRELLWGVFASRGMGFFALTTDADDVAPVEDFRMPPSGPNATISGRITDEDGAAISGARVGIAGHMSGLASDLAAKTDANGRYAITAVPQAVYPRVLVQADGYDRAVIDNVTVGAGGAVLDRKLRRDWASVLGGATVRNFTGPDFGAGCGPANGFDQSQGSGWASLSPDNPNGPGPKTVVLALPAAVDISSYEIDPGPVCGDDASAGAGQVLIETSGDGSTFSPSVSRSFSSGSNGHMNVVQPATAPKGVRYIRVTLVTPQSDEGSGAQFLDMAELAVYGKAASSPPPQRPPGAARLAIKLAKQTLRQALRKGLKLRLEADRAGTAAIAVDLQRSFARKLRLRRRAAGRARAALAPSTPKTLRVNLSKLTRTSKRRLIRAGRARFALRVLFTDRAGAQTVVRQTLKLKR